jgi:hypothetical protein
MFNRAAVFNPFPGVAGAMTLFYVARVDSHRGSEALVRRWSNNLDAFRLRPSDRCNASKHLPCALRAKNLQMLDLVLSLVNVVLVGLVQLLLQYIECQFWASGGLPQTQSMVTPD